jgi:23S rRNA (adenine2503-C2)-methyltransferase
MYSKRSLLELSPEQLPQWFVERGLPAFHAAQVRRWLFERRAAGFDEMTDLPRSVRRQLAADFSLWTSRIAAHRKADDGSEKLLLKLHDAEQIECVLLREGRQRRTICISTQVGCAVGCVFCASGLGGLVRNLQSGEIIEQMLHLQRLLGADERLSHIVVMGMGEPLANLAALLPALAAAASPDGLGVSARRITISSVGLPRGIRRLAEQDCQYHLAVSLHAADDELRRRLVPIARKVSMASIVAAADYYFARTGRRVTFEYVLLAGLNDRPEHARRLAALLKGRPALVNLIAYNPVASLPYRAPPPAAVAQFVETLKRGSVNVKIRRRKGAEIDAACGQLRYAVGGRRKNPP